MANENTTYSFAIAGIEVPPPKEWMDLDIESSFGDNIQPSLSIEAFTFLPVHFEAIDLWLSSYGHFEGCPFDITFNDGVNIETIAYCLDFNNYEIISPVERRIGIRPNNSLDSLRSRLDGISFGWLAEQKDSNNNYYITPTDFVNVQVTIKKRFDGTEVALISLSLAFISAQIFFFVTETGKNTIKKIKLILTSPSQQPAEIYEAIALIIILLAYAASMLSAVINLLKSLVQLAGIKTVYKAITLRKGLEILCRYLGYTLDCDIPEIDEYTYLPSKNDNKVRKAKRDDGCPNASDFGYNGGEFFELIRLLFLSRSAIIDGVVYIRALKSNFWYSQSTYIMPDILASENYSFNSNEMDANYLIKFQYDPQDEYTFPIAGEIDSQEKSTNFQMITELILNQTVQNKLNRGLKEVSIPMALAERRKELSSLENQLLDVLKVGDSLVKLFGGKPQFAELIKNERNRVLISQPNFSVAKLIPLKNGYMPNDPSTHLGARYLYDHYHYYQSFVNNADVAQHLVFKDKVIPFSFKDFVLTSKNGCFTTQDGRKGKFTSIKWRPKSDYAIASYWISEKYDNNLKAIHVES